MADGLLGFQDPTNIGLLSAGLGILSQANGPNSRGAIGQGALLGLNAFQGARENQAMEAYRQAQAEALRRKAAKDEAVLGYVGNIFGGAVPSQPAATPTGLLGSQSPAPQGGLLNGAQAMPVSSQPKLLPAPRAGLSGASLEQIAALKAMGGPDLMDAWKLSRFGVDSAPGSITTLADGSIRDNPNVDKGQQAVRDASGRVIGVRNLPGAVGAAAQMAGATTAATEGARAQLDLVDVPDGRGGSVKMPRIQAIEALGGGRTPAVRGMAGQPGAGRLGVTQSPADQAYDSELAKAASGTYSSLQDAGRAADKQISSYREIDRLLGDYEGGKLSGLGMSAAKLANSLDIKLDPKLADKEAAVAIGNELALQMRDPSSGMGMPGAMSDADREFLLQSVPNIGQSAGGRRQLIDYKVKMLERNKVVADSARKWQQKYGRIDAIDEQGNDFQTALKGWANQNPMFQQQSGGFANLWGG